MKITASLVDRFYREMVKKFVRLYKNYASCTFSYLVSVFFLTVDALKRV